MRIAIAIVLLLSGCHVYQEVGDDPDANVSQPDAGLAPDGGGTPIPSACGDCPSADEGKVSVCGWLRDAETNALIGTMDTNWVDCATISPRPTTGPCALEVRASDALMFAGNPTGTPSLEPSRMTINTCGRYIVENVAAPALGYMALSVDDHSALGADAHRLSAVIVSTSSRLQRDGLNLYAVRTISDAKWTTSAGSPFGSGTFGDRGTYMGIFLDRGAPVAGVVVTENGSAQPAEDYYFADTSATTRTTIDPAQNATGANGAALLVDSALVNHSGEGVQPANGCAWPSNLGDAIPGVYMVQERRSEMFGDVCQ